MNRPPLLSILGMAVAVLGVGLDLVVHLSAAGDGHEHVHVGFTLSEHAAHLVVMVGMVLILAGVVVDGVRRQLSRRLGPALVERSASDAIR
jgi:hypothetical protein